MPAMTERHSSLRWVVVAAVILALILLPFAFFEQPITQWSEAQLSGPPTALLGAVVMILLAVDVVLPVPSSIVNTASGALFGWTIGAMVAWGGLMIGCAGGWALGRSVGRAGLLRFMGKTDLSRAEAIAERFGNTAIVVSRPIPVLAEASTLLAGACGVPFRRMMLLSALSNAGISLVYAGVGAFSAQVSSFLLAFAAAVVLPGLAIVASRAFRGRGV